MAPLCTYVLSLSILPILTHRGRFYAAGSEKGYIDYPFSKEYLVKAKA